MRRLLFIVLLCGCEPSVDIAQLDRIETQVQTLLERTSDTQRQVRSLQVIDGKCTREVKEINLNLLKVPGGGNSITRSMFLSGDPEQFRKVIQQYCGSDWTVVDRPIDVGDE